MNIFRIWVNWCEFNWTKSAGCLGWKTRAEEMAQSVKCLWVSMKTWVKIPALCKSGHSSSYLWWQCWGTEKRKPLRLANFPVKMNWWGSGSLKYPDSKNKVEKDRRRPTSTLPFMCIRMPVLTHLYTHTHNPTSNKVKRRRMTKHSQFVVQTLGRQKQGIGIWTSPKLCSEFVARLGFMRSCLFKRERGQSLWFLTLLESL